MVRVLGIVVAALLVASSFAAIDIAELKAQGVDERVILRLLEHEANILEDIVGGVEVSPQFKYEFMASLQYSTGSHFCGGSLIDPEWILTAAHCSTGMAPSRVSVQLHRHNLDRTTAAEGGLKIAVDEIIIHPNYQAASTNRDIALWHLATPVTTLTPVALDSRGVYDGAGADSRVIGWGALREGGGVSNTLQEVDVPVVSQAVCETAYPRQITEFMVCAGYAQGGRDSCQGDSGGPLFVNGDSSSPIQIGIVSWGSGCARPNKYGVYARVSTLYDFVSETINAKRRQSIGVPK